VREVRQMSGPKSLLSARSARPRLVLFAAMLLSAAALPLSIATSSVAIAATIGFGPATVISGSPIGGVLESVSCTDATDCTAVGLSGIYVTESAGIWGQPA